MPNLKNLDMVPSHVNILHQLYIIYFLLFISSAGNSIHASQTANKQDHSTDRIHFFEMMTVIMMMIR